MCGIIGYTGEKDALTAVLRGLHRLEYRGYDSAGVTVSTGNSFYTEKCPGRVSRLEEKLKAANHAAYDTAPTAIGHTRWATHGAPDAVNAHPHAAKHLFLVHNGIIENAAKLREELEGKGIAFASQTDTEAAAHLISDAYEQCRDPIRAIRNAEQRLQGSYAFCILFRDFPRTLYAVRYDSPLLIGRGGHGAFVASDINACPADSESFYPLQHGQIAAVKRDSIRIFDASGAESEPAMQPIGTIENEADTGSFATYMEKEIHEQPRALRDTLLPLVSDDVPLAQRFGLGTDLRRLTLVGCGSAMHAALLGKWMITTLSGVDVRVEIASEYRYTRHAQVQGAALWLISQSGETADTIAAMRMGKELGLPTTSIVNVPTSTLSTESDHVIPMRAGAEIAVATTKGYLTQAAILALTGVLLMSRQADCTQQSVRALTHSICEQLPQAVGEVIRQRQACLRAAQYLSGRHDVFYIGRGGDYYAAMECALKLKEITYLHCEAYAAGELKHGTISLITEGTPVIAIATDEKLFAKTMANVREVKSRGAHVTVICSENLEPEAADEVIRIPALDPIIAPIPAVVAGQIIALESAVLLGRDVDKPRNLAKSVTVE